MSKPEWTCGLCSCLCVGPSCPVCGNGEVIDKAPVETMGKEAAVLATLEAQSGKPRAMAKTLREWIRKRTAA